ncbi:MMPL family transporter [Micromonospora sp. NPDC049230]|uniref:MMPL family transporter n=1 Tax=Micromonospora sp. NPDC049230 TaxID=3155502 RepID=UPI0033C5153E
MPIAAAGAATAGGCTGCSGAVILSLKLFGLTLAAAVLFDAFLVRMTLMPAAMALLGRRVWWLPRWLDRVLPNANIEGGHDGRETTPSRAAANLLPASGEGGA